MIKQVITYEFDVNPTIDENIASGYNTGQWWRNNTIPALFYHLTDGVWVKINGQTPDLTAVWEAINALMLQIAAIHNLTAADIKALLETLTGSNRLKATAIDRISESILTVYGPVAVNGTGYTVDFGNFNTIILNITANTTLSLNLLTMVNGGYQLVLKFSGAYTVTFSEAYNSLEPVSAFANNTVIVAGLFVVDNFYPVSTRIFTGASLIIATNPPILNIISSSVSGLNVNVVITNTGGASDNIKYAFVTPGTVPDFAVVGYNIAFALSAILPSNIGTYDLYMELVNAGGASIKHISNVVINAVTPSLVFTTTGTMNKYTDSTAFYNNIISPSAGAVTFTSSNPTAVSVNSTTGLITILTAGSAVITASQAASGNYLSATTTFTVSVAEPTALLPVTLTFASPSISKMSTDGTFTNLATSNSPAAIVYASGNTTIATVNPTTGVITIVGAGTCTISAYQAATSVYDTASTGYSLVVSAPIVVQNPTIVFATLTQISKIVNAGNFTNLATSNSTGAIVYSSSNTAVATVDPSTGLVTMIAPGTTTITADQASTIYFYAATTSYTLTVSAVPAATTEYRMNFGAPAIAAFGTIAAGWNNLDNLQQMPTAVNATYSPNGAFPLLTSSGATGAYIKTPASSAGWQAPKALATNTPSINAEFPTAVISNANVGYGNWQATPFYSVHNIIGLLPNTLYKLRVMSVVDQTVFLNGGVTKAATLEDSSQFIFEATIIAPATTSTSSQSGTINSITNNTTQAVVELQATSNVNGEMTIKYKAGDWVSGSSFWAYSFLNAAILSKV